MCALKKANTCARGHRWKYVAVSPTVCEGEGEQHSWGYQLTEAVQPPPSLCYHVYLRIPPCTEIRGPPLPPGRTFDQKAIAWLSVRVERRELFTDPALNRSPKKHLKHTHTHTLMRACYTELMAHSACGPGWSQPHPSGSMQVFISCWLRALTV